MQIYFCSSLRLQTSSLRRLTIERLRYAYVTTESEWNADGGQELYAPAYHAVQKVAKGRSVFSAGDCDIGKCRSLTNFGLPSFFVVKVLSYPLQSHKDYFCVAWGRIPKLGINRYTAFGAKIVCTGLTAPGNRVSKLRRY